MAQILETIGGEDLDDLLNGEDAEGGSSPHLEIVLYGFEILLKLCESVDESKAINRDASTVPYCVLFSEIILKDASNVRLILEYFVAPDFYLKYYSVQLIKRILKNVPEKARLVIVQSQGISKILGLLEEQKKIVLRNDAVMLLLLLLEVDDYDKTVAALGPKKDIKDDVFILNLNEEERTIDIQKILVFENSFEKILEILSQEIQDDQIPLDSQKDFADQPEAENVIILDCLQVVVGLLANNASTQVYFKETNCLAQLLKLFKSFKATHPSLSYRSMTLFLNIFVWYPALVIDDTDILCTLIEGLGNDHKPSRNFYRWRSSLMAFLLTIARAPTSNAFFAKLTELKVGPDPLLHWLFKTSLDDRELPDCFSLVSLYMEKTSDATFIGTITKDYLVEEFWQGLPKKDSVSKYLIVLQYLSLGCCKNQLLYEQLLQNEKSDRKGDEQDLLGYIFCLVTELSSMGGSKKSSKASALADFQIAQLQEHLFLVLFCLTQSSTFVLAEFFKDHFASRNVQFFLDSLRQLSTRLDAAAFRSQVSSALPFFAVAGFVNIMYHADTANSQYFTREKLLNLSKVHHVFMGEILKDPQVTLNFPFIEDTIISFRRRTLATLTGALSFTPSDPSHGPSKSKESSNASIGFPDEVPSLSKSQCMPNTNVEEKAKAHQAAHSIPGPPLVESSTVQTGGSFFQPSNANSGISCNEDPNTPSFPMKPTYPEPSNVVAASLTSIQMPGSNVSPEPHQQLTNDTPTAAPFASQAFTGSTNNPESVSMVHNQPVLSGPCSLRPNEMSERGHVSPVPASIKLVSPAIPPLQLSPAKASTEPHKREAREELLMTTKNGPHIPVSSHANSFEASAVLHDSHAPPVSHHLPTSTAIIDPSSATLENVYQSPKLQFLQPSAIQQCQPLAATSLNGDLVMPPLSPPPPPPLMHINQGTMRRTSPPFTGTKRVYHENLFNVNQPMINDPPYVVLTNTLIPPMMTMFNGRNQEENHHASSSSSLLIDGNQSQIIQQRQRQNFVNNSHLQQQQQQQQLSASSAYGQMTSSLMHEEKVRGNLSNKPQQFFVPNQQRQ